MDNNLCIVIKAPNQKYDDVKVKCEPSWTILDLKKYLSAEYPSKPKLGDQRLIYSGHLLKDGQSLSEIIEPSDDSQHTFHLVVPQRSATSSDGGPTNNPSTSAANPDSSNVPSSSPGLNSIPMSSPFVVPGMFNHGDLLGAGNANIQETYNAMMQQYMQQYMSYYYPTQTLPPMAFPSFEAYLLSMQASMFNTNQIPTDYINSLNQFNNNNLRVNDNQVNANVNNQNNNNNNNNNNDVEAEEGGNRNWTELFASVSKVVVLMSIIYFYTSLGRLLLLAAIVLTVYLYRYASQHNNILNDQLRRENNNEANDERPGIDTLGNGDDNNNNNNNNNFENGSTNVRLNGLRLVWVFVSSLFTSLIPDPVPMN